MVILLKESLCGCSLKTGSEIIGWLALIGCSVYLVWTIISFYCLATAYNDDNTIVVRIIKNYTITTVFIVLLVILCIYLLVGLHKDRMSYIFPWIVVNTLTILSFIADHFVTSFLLGSLIPLNVIFIAEWIYVYLILIVYSHYRFLKREAESKSSCSNIVKHI